MNNQKLYIIGDIHGEFKTLVHLITERYKMTNCHIIVAGDIGLGFYKVNYYVDMFSWMNKRLKEKNIHLYFVRGNHDRPDWFENPPEYITIYPYIHIVKDYTVLNLCGHHILCIGGAVSIDKKFRYPGISWWAGENIKRVDDLSEVIKTNNIDVVVTHTNPIFIEPGVEPHPWMSTDDFELTKTGAKTLAEVFFYLLENNNPLKYWVHGHHHTHIETFVTNTFTDTDKQYLLSGMKIKPDEYKDGPIKIVCLDMMENKLDILEIA